MSKIVKTLFSLIFAFAFIFSGAVIAQEKVMKGGDGKYFIQKEVVPPVDTGVMVEEGIVLTPSQLQKIMSGGRFVIKSTTVETWGRYYLYRVHHTHATEVVKLKEGVVGRVAVDTREVEEKFTPLLPAAGVYFLMIFALKILAHRQLLHTIPVLVATASLAVLAIGLVTTSTILSIIAFLAVLFVGAAVEQLRTKNAEKVSNWFLMIGACTMALLVSVELIK